MLLLQALELLELLEHCSNTCLHCKQPCFAGLRVPLQLCPFSTACHQETEAATATTVTVNVVAAAAQAPTGTPAGVSTTPLCGTYR